MKIIVVPDVHGTDKWKKVKNIPEDEYDYVVFLGDYFDSWDNVWPEQGNNAIEIFEWIKENPKKRKACIGNHDFSYLSLGRDGASVSGHQYNHITDIRKILMKYSPYIDLAFKPNEWCFSHAGITKTWVNDLIAYLHLKLDKYPSEYYNTNHFESQEEYHKKMEAWNKEKKTWDDSEFDIDFLNKYFHNVSHQIGDGHTDSSFDELLDWRGLFSPSGDEPRNSCIWVRPSSLLDDAHFDKQVVGHTELCYKDEWVRLRNKENKIVVTDSSSHSNIFIFDTDNPGDFITIPEFNRNYKNYKKNKQREENLKK